MAIAYLSRAVAFAAQHQYHKPDWSAERNREFFGACAEEHDHDYRCLVTVRGPIQPNHELVMDMGLLDRILDEEVTRRFHGRAIHRDLPEFADGKILPSTEGLAVYIWQRIVPRLPPGVRLHVVRVEENPHLYTEYFGEA